MVGVTASEGSVLSRITDAIIPRSFTELWGTTLYESNYFYFNYWSINHILAGVFFYFVKIWIFPKWSFKKLVLWWIVLDMGFEIVEYILGFGGHPLFYEESIDIFWDLVFTIGGFILTGWIFEKHRGKRIKGKEYLKEVVKGEI
ncbi:MAG: hypothetical protein ABIF88_00250 [archaeon]